MQDQSPQHLEQVRAITDTIRNLFQDALLAVNLHGSAVAGGLRPQSDIDLLAVIDRSMTRAQRKALLSDLLRLSGRHPAPLAGPRCIEVMVFLKADLTALAFPARAEFVYGEWLRDSFEAGQLPMPVSDPENTLVLAQARQVALPLFGSDLKALLPDVPLEHVRNAMRDNLPALVGGLRGDERNVLLTLARMWRTAVTGEFIAKDAAATWAALRMPDHDTDTLIYAREAYLGRIDDQWEDRRSAAWSTAAHLRQRVSELL